MLCPPSPARQVARHGSLLLGKKSNGRLLKNMFQWLLHAAVFSSLEGIRDRALIGLLVLIGVSGNTGEG